MVVDNHGTGGGFSNYLNGEIDIVDASRLAKPDEESKAKAQGLDWTRFLVGYDGITVVVNSENTFVKSLSVAKLKAIWEPESKVKTWRDVDPSWPDRSIVLYSPDNVVLSVLLWQLFQSGQPAPSAALASIIVAVALPVIFIARRTFARRVGVD